MKIIKNDIYLKEIKKEYINKENNIKIKLTGTYKYNY